MSPRIAFTLALAAGLIDVGNVSAQPAKNRKGEYGRTPANVAPYRRYGKPYRAFFLEPVDFAGPGRDVPPPEGLTEVKIGFLGPLEGSTDVELGRAMQRGAQLALDHANAAGGYRGLKYVLVSRNDTGLWGATSNEMVALAYDEKVWAVLGSIDGNNTHIALRVALKAEVAMVTTGATDPTITETNIPWIVRPAADDRQHGYALARHVFAARGLRKVVVLRTTSRYGRLGVSEFRDAARRLGSPLVMELLFTPETDLTPHLDRMREAEAEGVIIWADAQEAGRAVRFLRDNGFDKPIFGGDRVASQAFLKAAGPAADGVVAAASFDPTRDDPRWNAFRAAFREQFDEEPDGFAAHAYDGMNLIVGAIATAGLNRPLIRDALADLREVDGVTGHIVFDATHNDVGPVWLARVEGGTLTYTPAPADH